MKPAEHRTVQSVRIQQEHKYQRGSTYHLSIDNEIFVIKKGGEIVLFLHKTEPAWREGKDI